MRSKVDIQEAHRQLQLNLYRENREQWLDLARHHAQRIARERGSVCTDDLWPIVGEPPHGVDRRAIAGAFRGMVKVKELYSGRSVCHHRKIGLWVLVEEFTNRFGNKQSEVTP